MGYLVEDKKQLNDLLNNWKKFKKGDYDVVSLGNISIDFIEDIILEIIEKNFMESIISKLSKLVHNIEEGLRKIHEVYR